MRSKLFHLLPWLILVTIVVATLSPLQFRPRTDEPPQVERFLAYGALGLSFALAFPRAWWIALPGLPAVAYLLEMGQRLTADRHWGLSDVEAKMAGSVAGVVLGLAIVLLIAMLQRSRSGAPT